MSELRAASHGKRRMASALRIMFVRSGACSYVDLPQPLRVLRDARVDAESEAAVDATADASDDAACQDGAVFCDVGRAPDTIDARDGANEWGLAAHVAEGVGAAAGVGGAM